MRWLHISDLHFGESSAKQNYLVDAIKDLEKPEFIVVTGDLHTYPKKISYADSQELNLYNKAQEFLDDLLRHWELSKNDIFIVPGNHDVDIASKYEELQDLFTGTAVLPDYDNGSESFFLHNGVHLSKRFCLYTEFIKEFFGENHEASQDSAGVFIRTWNDKLNILHINTALYSTKDNMKEQHIVDTYALSKLRLNPRQRNLPTLLLAHHSFFRLEQYLQNDIKAALNKLNVVAYLCGDKHVEDRNTICLGDAGRSIDCITCMSSAFDSSHWSNMGYLEYIWDGIIFHSAECVVHHWNPHRNEEFGQKSFPVNMNFGIGNAPNPHLQCEIKEQIECLDPILLPGIRDEARGTTYENKLPKDEGQSDTKESQFPLIRLLYAQKDENKKQFYLFEGRRSTRGGTGKTSSLLSVFRSPNLCQEFLPIYIQLRVLNTEDTLFKQIENHVGPRNGHRFLLLLDGFDEIASNELRGKRIREILEWNNQYHEIDIIVMTGRDLLESYLRVADVSKLFQDDDESILKVFDNYRVIGLSSDQQKAYLSEPLPSETDRVWDILDNPFFVSRYRESKQTITGSALRWLTPDYSNWISTNSENQTSLMLGSLFYEINRLATGKKDVVARKRFILTKLLPALAYRKLLAARTADFGMPESMDESLILERQHIMKTLSCLLNTYHLVLKCWPEYRGQVDRDNFYAAWKSFWEPGSSVSPLLDKSEYIIGPLTIDGNGDYCFSHMIYQEFFAAFHIANIVCAIKSGMKISGQSSIERGIICLLLEHIDHHILLQAEEILEQYWGIPFCSNLLMACEKCLQRHDSLSMEELVLCQILIRFIDASIMRNPSDKHKTKWMEKRHTLFIWFQKDYSIAIKGSPGFQLQYKQFYLYVLALLARDFRSGTGCSINFERCKAYVNLAIKHQRVFEVPKADSYLQMGLFLDSLLQNLLNDPGFKIFEIISKKDLSVDMADEILNAIYALCNDDTQPIAELEKKYAIKTTPGTRGGSLSYYKLLLYAQKAYLQSKSIRTRRLKIARLLGYVSKAYLVLAAIGTSGGALNRLGLMFENQTNAMEHYPKTAISSKIGMPVKKFDITSMLYQENYVHSYKMYQIIYDIRRGDQPYSSRKMVELIIKARVSIENGIDQPVAGTGIQIKEAPPYVLIFLEQAIQKADNGYASLSNYWHGRIFLIRANMDCPNRMLYLKTACDFFCKEIGEGKDNYFNYDEYLTKKLKLPVNILLSSIELLAIEIRGIDKIPFCSPLQNVCEAILFTLEEQFKGIYLNSDKPLFDNGQYCLAPVDILDNITRFKENAGDLMDNTRLTRLAQLEANVADVKKRFW